MPKKDPRVDAYIAKSPEYARPILKHLRKLVHTACPEVEETIKWSFASFDYKGPFCSMAAFKAHCVLVSGKPNYSMIQKAFCLRRKMKRWAVLAGSPVSKIFLRIK